MERWETAGDGPRLAVKDCIDVAGSVTTVGCPVIAERADPAARDAKVVALARLAGARIAGKTNLTELCWSASGINTWSGTPVNPAAPQRIPGGSSSGSAVAVANNEADVALGTDTGGSVRIPAACCGVTGLKTTWGRVPVDGLYPLAPSLDTVGWLGKDLAAIELGMRLIEPGFTVQQVAGPLTAGRLRPEGFSVAPEVDEAVDAALSAAGITVTTAGTIDVATAVGAANTIIDYEGYRANEYLLPDIDRLSHHNQRNLREAAAITGDELTLAQRVQRTLRGQFDALLADHGFLVLPVLTGPPPLLGEQGGILLTALTAPVNLVGLPALAIPLPARDYPMSLQVIGGAGAEERLIAFGRVIETAVNR